eukprot:TRINITY_DN4343_c0_g1_i2.p1 TRINITY_DN4343_c0_g1~~TRINITY_DN4343_c0_g1_i2.p1  ORF type:complete len:402 (+),score=45.73 TRINITY_DN4343_c0_g1_i2:73-1278(+)
MLRCRPFFRGRCLRGLPAPLSASVYRHHTSLAIPRTPTSLKEQCRTAHRVVLECSRYKERRTQEEELSFSQHMTMMGGSREVVLESSYSGLRIGARVWGHNHDVADVRILCAHGWMDNAATFDGLIPLLLEKHEAAATGKTVSFVCLDLPGHGMSDHRPSHVPYHFLDYVPDILSVIDHLKWKEKGLQFSLMGHSLGAAIMSHVAGVLGDTFNEDNRVVLVEGIGAWTAEPSTALDELKRAYANNTILLARTKTKRVYPNMKAAIDRLQSNNKSLAPHSVLTLVQRGVMFVDPNGNEIAPDVEPTVDTPVAFRHDVKLQMKSHYRLGEDHVTPFLQNIRCPVMCIDGTNGLQSFKDNLAKRKPLFRDMQVLEVEGGHHVHLDSPGAMAGPVYDFLLGDRKG